MGGKKAAGENSKKAAGNARKADAASQKKAAEDQKKAAEEDKQWSKGSKSNAKKEDAEAKKAEAARKKAERDAQMAEEEAAAPSKPKGAGAKTAQKKSRGLDLSQLDDAPSKKGSSLNASGIDNALDALSLTNKDTTKVERHPERRFKAAYAAFEARRLPEIEEENPGLRRQQRMDLCRKEFEKSEENPFNQVHVAVNASKEEIAAVREQERSKTERRLG
ncbi:Coiled-coil domain-containing protein [Penicillium longicatenatum]|nr:Coiled-coil domain-containing protein [Penicillium longicatenatum]